MIIHNLVQGSPEWLSHRAKYFNASDAPAMLGVSKYTKRSELLHRIHTGLTPDVDSFTQKKFDDGHLFEALARPVAEEIIGDELSPVTGTEGIYGASFDGLTFTPAIGFEHKTLNDAIRSCNTIDDLDEMYLIQMEQQCMVSGAIKILFLATLWEKTQEITEHFVEFEDGTRQHYKLLEQKSFWYMPNESRRQRIIDGWDQFAKDLETFVPAEAVAQPKAEAIKALPAIIVKVNSSVVSSNLPMYKAEAEEFIARINLKPVTDQEYADADAMAKFLKDGEDEMDKAEKDMLAENPSVDEITRTMRYIKDLMRNARLELERAVKVEKENRKLKIINDANTEYKAHIDAINADIAPIRGTFFTPVFADAIKGKSKFDSMIESVGNMLREAKSLADGVGRDIRAKQAWLKANADGYQFLFADLNSIITKPAEDFQLLVTSRIDAHKQEEARKAAETKSNLDQVKTIEQEAVKPAIAAPSVSSLSPIQKEQVNDVLIENQDALSLFLRARDFGKDTNKIRAILVEFVKFQAELDLRKAA